MVKASPGVLRCQCFGPTPIEMTSASSLRA
jgi:hypothetical protein